MLLGQRPTLIRLSKESARCEISLFLSPPPPPSLSLSLSVSSTSTVVSNKTIDVLSKWMFTARVHLLALNMKTTSRTEPRTIGQKHNTNDTMVSVAPWAVCIILRHALLRGIRWSVCWQHSLRRRWPCGQGTPGKMENACDRAAVPTGPVY